MTERHRAQRNTLRLPVTVWQRGEGGQRASGHIMDVSAGGAYIATYDLLPTDTLVVLEIAYPDRTARVSAQIVHNESVEVAAEKSLFSAGMGVSFDLPEDPEVLELAKLGRPLEDSGGRRKHPR